jgi:hypothetical protein
MTQQPQALQLADALERCLPHDSYELHTQQEAAAELRRLHSVNAQLLEALDYFIQCVEQSAHFDARIGFMGGAFDKARAAIAAVKGEA